MIMSYNLSICNICLKLGRNYMYIEMCPKFSSFHVFEIKAVKGLLFCCRLEVCGIHFCYIKKQKIYTLMDIGPW